MADDEAATVKTITTYRDTFFSLTGKHHGRVVDSPGDNILIEFVSVVDAVRCATEIQAALRTRNAELPEKRRMIFRIGINLGDIIQEGERIYGDGVNIAARIESLADPGGISISGTVYDSVVGKKLGLGYEYSGEKSVKNIAKPVRVYKVMFSQGTRAQSAVTPKERIHRPWIKTALIVAAVLLLGLIGAIWRFYPSPSPSKAKPDLPDKPSIAVLPFVNMSADPQQEYFSDGLTEDIITGLSKIPRLFVIARNSSFTYKGRPVKVQQVGRELGVRDVKRNQS